MVAAALLATAAVAFHLSPVPPRARVAAPSPTAHALAVALPIDGGAAAVPNDEPVKVLYDGQCMVCLSNKALLSFFDRRAVKRLNFINIRDDNYSPSKNGGVTFEDAMRHFHVIDGTKVAEGSDAVLLAYTKVGLGWLMAVLRFPLIRWFVDALYSVVSRHRYTISRFLPGGAALTSAVTSLKDVETAAMGGGCDDEEECMLDYDDDDDDGDAATAA